MLYEGSISFLSPAPGGWPGGGDNTMSTKLRTVPCRINITAAIEGFPQY